MLYTPVPTIPAVELLRVLLCALREPEEQRTRFREMVRAYVGTNTVQDFCCARAALEHLFRCTGVKKLVMPAFICSELGELLVRLNIKPVFADIELETLNLSPESLQEVLDRRTDAVLAVHAFGNPCELSAISELVSDAKAILVEDCAHALGARYRGMPAGSFGDFSVFSMYKLLPTSAGGFLCSKQVLEEPREAGAPGVQLLRLAYVTRELHPLLLRLKRKSTSGSGYSMRRCSVLDLSIFNRLFPRIEELTLRRRRFAEALAKELGNYRLQRVLRDARPSWQSFAVLLPEDCSSGAVAAHLLKRGVVAHRTWHDALILQPEIQRRFGVSARSYPATLEASRRIITLPVQPGYTSEDARLIAEAFESAVSSAC